MCTLTLNCTLCVSQFLTKFLPAVVATAALQYLMMPYFFQKENHCCNIYFHHTMCFLNFIFCNVESLLGLALVFILLTYFRKTPSTENSRIVNIFFFWNEGLWPTFSVLHWGLTKKKAMENASLVKKETSERVVKEYRESKGLTLVMQKCQVKQ